jgi:hypothetical protein
MAMERFGAALDGTARRHAHRALPVLAHGQPFVEVLLWATVLVIIFYPSTCAFSAAWAGPARRRCSRASWSWS